MIERTRHRYEDVHRLLDTGWTVSAIGRRLHHRDRKTVRRFRDTSVDELLSTAHHRRRSRVLGPYQAYINTLFAEAGGQVSGSRLFRELRTHGYRGSRSVVREYLATLRKGHTGPVRVDVPSPHRITSWIMRSHKSLNVFNSVTDRVT